MRMAQYSIRRRGARWLANRGILPTALEAVLGYYADAGIFDLSALRLKRRVDETVAAITGAAFDAIARELERELDRDGVEFAYDTKLILPAELTLGYIYRDLIDQAPVGFDPVTGRRDWSLRGMLRRNYPGSGTRGSRVLTEEERGLAEEADRATAITTLIVEALIEGDIRDAINDNEYADFEVNFTTSSVDERRRIAETAQAVLRSSVRERFDQFPEGVEDAYEWAVEVSERHQAKDDYFRELVGDQAPGNGEMVARVRDEYKYAEFESFPALFGASERDLPYLKTQYRRVGVIYDGMIEMYRAAGFAIDDAFKKSIVLAIIGAQIWLDDIDDFREDNAEGQLTPVIAEYLLADTDRIAYENTIRITEQYLDLAKRYAMESGTPLTGIAVEYILRSGNPTALPHS